MIHINKRFCQWFPKSEFLSFLFSEIAQHNGMSEVESWPSLPCYLVPSSRVRLLVIPMIIFLQASRTLVILHSSVSVQFVTALMPSSHRVIGLPLFLAPSPIHNIIDFSKLFSLLMMCPTYDSCCFFIQASSGLVSLVSSITDLLVHLAVHGIRSRLLQHHNSKLSILGRSLAVEFSSTGVENTERR